MKQTKNIAFTLVELIVVITILAVLATVAFISFQGYTSSSRDSVRLADLKNISKSFEFMKTKDQELPLPDQKVDITASGTIFQYQGVLEEQTLKLSNIHNGGLDPLDGEPYGYAVNAQRNKFQVIGFLENAQTAGNNLLSQSLADNTDKVIKTTGDALGIILDETTKEIITLSGSLTQIDIETNTTDYTVVKSTDEITTGDNDFLYSQFEHIIKPNVSCKSILHNGQSTGNGIYTINPTGVNGEEFEVYCDMSTDGGGWAVVAMSFANANGDTSLPFNQDFATVRDVGVGSINNLEDNYFISMSNYSKLADKKSQKEYLWMARSRFSTDPWQETLRYNKHYITDEAGGFAWYGVYKQGGKLAYNGRRISTSDVDNDSSTTVCTETYGSFGWYTGCHHSHFWTQTEERSICGTNSDDIYSRGGEYFCEENNSYGPDAAGSYNTWHSLKIMIR